MFHLNISFKIYKTKNIHILDNLIKNQTLNNNSISSKCNNFKILNYKQSKKLTFFKTSKFKYNSNIKTIKIFFKHTNKINIKHKIS